MQDLAQIRGLSEAKVEKILEAAKKMCTAGGWQSAFEVERQVWLPACACMTSERHGVLLYAFSNEQC